MDIKTFVSESLTQIIQGVEQAQKENQESAVNASFGSSYTKRKKAMLNLILL